MATQIDLGKLWARVGGITNPGSTKYEGGWVAEIPTYQNFNYVLNALDNNILYLAEKSIFAWQADINYEVGAKVFESGKAYECVVAHINQQPSLDATFSYWVTGTKIGSTATVVKQQHGLLIGEVNNRTATIWNGNDVTLENANSIVAFNTSNGPTKNLLFGNVSGEMVVVDVGTTTVPDNRNIALGQSGVHRIYHEGNKPTQADVAGTIPTAPTDGKIYGRKDSNWVEVSSTSVSVSPPPPVQGNGQGWYNLDDGRLYIDIDDGDSSQWVSANPPQIPNYKAEDVSYVDSKNNLGTDLQIAMDNLSVAAQRKNLLINGNFDIWQRGSTFSSNINEYTADRWVARNGIGGTTTIVKAENPITGAYLSMQCVGNTSYAALWQVIEVSSPRDVEDKPFTLSIETDFDNAAEMEVESYWVDSDTQEQRSATMYSSAVNIGAGTETNSVSFSAPTITTPTGDLNLVVSIIFNRQSSLPDGFYRVFRAQLEEGSIATPFEYRPIGEELALCQRYYQRAGLDEFYLLPSNSSGQIQRQTITFPVQMRATPTVSLNKTAGAADVGTSPIQNSTTGLRLGFTGLADDYAQYNWIADAEL